MQIIDLILLQLITVFIVDLSGGIESLKLFISSYLTKSKIKSTNFSLKPIDCSLCMMHWIGVIYLLFTGFTIPLYAVVCILSLLTPVTSNLLLYIRDSINKHIN